MVKLRTYRVKWSLSGSRTMRYNDVRAVNAITAKIKVFGKESRGSRIIKIHSANLVRKQRRESIKLYGYKKR